MALPTLMELVRRSTDYLTQHGITNARRETEWIFAETLALTRMDLYTRFDMPLEDHQVDRLRHLVQRRGRREPLAYVLGNQAFGKLTLKVGPGVLVPRPETEELVEFVLAQLPADTQVQVLDVGTGSGAIALGVKQAHPAWEVTATDASEEALAFARANGERLQLAVHWAHGHLAREQKGPFDLVVANLPYIGESERAQCDPELAFEPQRALFSGADGLDLRGELNAELPRLLTSTGEEVFEHGWTQIAAISAIAQANGFTSKTIRDLAGKDRFAHLTRAV